MVDRIEIKHMRVFMHLMKEKNASRVGLQIGLSQQAISEYLKKLREEFNDVLFVRNSNGLTPTDFAFELAIKFERVLAEVDKLNDDTPYDLKSLKREYTIIANEHAQQAIIPVLVSKVIASAPNISFKILDFYPEQYKDMLLSGEADLLIGFKAFIDQGLNQIELKKDHYACAVGNRSDLINQIHSLKDLEKFPHVSVSNRKDQLNDTVDSFLKKHDISRKVIAILPCYTSLQRFLDANDVITFLPSALAPGANLKLLDLDDQPESFDIVAAWHGRSSHNQFHKWMIEMLLGLN
ncbi:LysR family transcriptional regulator [Pseudomonas nunensis]|uniref:LysR family transcriptional regulator n=1 Tax=Pseudomonas nunensis TaxID=2961896 RepID=A0ABY5E8X3_9PSED|nr:LysR family transcriptional regulator [Pseudomonas nunensis]KPN92023.1 hypothetical protein AL066_17440 [Pseudomonas nunensis]MCL5226799.1 LysR family transcriptional regulator [Pseudomonas nunensis]UTO12243.1 LysR family transcriptional regulator [Pseudomonas nunensis]